MIFNMFVTSKASFMATWCWGPTIRTKGFDQSLYID